MKNIVRLLAILVVLLAANAVPSSAIIPICGEFCDCTSNCDWGCWDTVTRSGTNCGDWGLCVSTNGCGGNAVSGQVQQAAWLVPLTSATAADTARSVPTSKWTWSGASCSSSARQSF
ncbi:MAG TPA: hypothetical protein VMM92_12945 [Thermoanaerobaculia bacterium]|nr:hypothetical protein [Thermoanaerobaculia bacterium]